MVLLRASGERGRRRAKLLHFLHRQQRRRRADARSPNHGRRFGQHAHRSSDEHRDQHQRDQDFNECKTAI